jgi:hypothetical protein
MTFICAPPIATLPIRTIVSCACSSRLTSL